MATRPQPADQLRSQAAQVADSVTATASQATDSLKDTLREQADARLDGIAEQVNTIGDVLQETAQHLREKQSAVLASEADHLASRAHAVSRHLRESSFDTLLREGQDYTRSRPGLVLGAAAILGFATARLFKIGGARALEHQSSMTTSSPANPVVTPMYRPSTSDASTRMSAPKPNLPGPAVERAS